MIKFEALEESDALKIVEWNMGKTEDFLFQWSGKTVYTYPLTEAQVIDRIQGAFCDVLKIVDNGEMVGTVEVLSYDEVNRSVRFGRLLVGDAFRGMGYGTKAIEFVEAFVVEKYLPDTLELGVYEFNRSAKRLYEKMGFVEIQAEIDEENSEWTSYTMSKRLAK